MFPALIPLPSHYTYIMHGLASFPRNHRVRSSCLWPAVPQWKDRPGESCRPWECWSIFAASKFTEEARPPTSRYTLLPATIKLPVHPPPYEALLCGVFCVVKIGTTVILLPFRRNVVQGFGLSYHAVVLVIRCALCCT